MRVRVARPPGFAWDVVITARLAVRFSRAPPPSRGGEREEGEVRYTVASHQLGSSKGREGIPPSCLWQASPVTPSSRDVDGVDISGYCSERLRYHGWSESRSIVSMVLTTFGGRTVERRGGPTERVGVQVQGQVPNQVLMRSIASRPQSAQD